MTSSERNLSYYAYTIGYQPGNISVYLNNSGSVLPSIYMTINTTVKTYVLPIICCIGIPGNVLSFFIWLQPNMRNSTGVYLASLAVSDTLVLLMHLFTALHSSGHMAFKYSHVVCISLSMMHVAFECLSLLVVMCLTVDWYIIICHPMKRHKLCTMARTVRVIALMVCISFLLGACEAIFWDYDNGTHDCEIRTQLRSKSGYLTMELGNLAILLVGVITPALVVLILNYIIVRKLKNNQRTHNAMIARRTRSTRMESTMMLLYVSSYLVVAEIIDLCDFLLAPFFHSGDPSIPFDLRGHDPMWLRYYRFSSVALILGSIALTTYATNILIYSLTGRKFRRTFMRLICRARRPTRDENGSRLSSQGNSGLIYDPHDMRILSMCKHSSRKSPPQSNCTTPLNGSRVRSELKHTGRAISLDIIDTAKITNQKEECKPENGALLSSPCQHICNRRSLSLD